MLSRKPEETDLTILCLVTDAYGGRGGVAAYNRELVSALAITDAVQRTIVLPRLKFAEDFVLPEKVVHDTSGLGGLATYGGVCLAYAFGRLRIDRVHCGHINLAPLAELVARVRQVPCSLTIHGIDAWDPHPRYIVRRALPAMDKVLAVSRRTAERFTAWSGLTNVAIVPNSVRLADFGVGPRRTDLIERYGLADSVVLMTFGRLAGQDRAKGFDEVLEILPTLAREIPSVVYLICGDGPDRERLEAKARGLGVAERVIFSGYVAQDEKADHYRLADVFVMPSRGEGFGIVLLEAMACGVPVIGSLADGTRDALLDGRLGRLVDPDEPEQLLAAIRAALGDSHNVPAGLEYYSFDSFATRLQDALRLCNALSDRRRFLGVQQA